MHSDEMSERADRLLSKMHPVFSHDLPNQLVAMQGLLHLMDQDGEFSPGSNVQEYVARLNRVSRKAAGLVHFLKEMGRLSGYQRRIEAVSLDGIMREIKVQLQQQLSDVSCECVVADDARIMRADPRLLRMAIVEIVRCLAERGAGVEVSVRLTARHTLPGDEIQGRLTWSAAALVPRRPNDREPLENRHEMILAREMLAAWGALVTAVRESPTDGEFTVLVPVAVVYG